MRTPSLNLLGAIRAAVVCRALRWVAIDTVLGAACGAFFGIVFGAFGLLLNAHSWNILSVASYFGLCGAVAGAIVGACGAVLEGDDVSDLASCSSKSSPPKTTAAAPVLDLPVLEMSVLDMSGPGHQSSHRLPQNRLVDVDRRDQNKGSRNPSRN